jgi:FAD/FMN-containing dehydrogenase
VSYPAWTISAIGVPASRHAARSIARDDKEGDVSEHPSAAAISAARSLRADIHGTVIVPGDPEYDDARAVWNGMIDRHPVAVVRVADATDVVAAIAFGRQHGLPIAVRGGGHNVAGNGTVDDGVVIDLAALDTVDIDEAGGTVRVGGGATLGMLDRATEPRGLVVAGGVVSETGVAGLTLGGGVGWLTRKHGLTIDNLVAADVVTANGELVHASQDENPDLLWGLKGGGGNFGVVTSFEFRSHSLPAPLYAGNIIHTRETWADALRFYAAWTAGQPDEMTSIITFITLPDGMLPPEVDGQPVMVIAFVWAGEDREAGERLIAPLAAYGPPAVVAIEPVSWLDWQSQVDAIVQKGIRAYWKNCYFDHLDEATIATIVEIVDRRVSPLVGVDIHHMGGAFGRVPEDDTAFTNRGAGFWLNLYAMWHDPAHDDANRRWARDSWAAMQPHAAEGMYVNFLGADGGGLEEIRDAARAAYGEHKLTRLTDLKDRYDPDNVFRLNHNIPPRG